MYEHMYKVALLNQDNGRPLHKFAEEQLAKHIKNPYYIMGNLFPK